MTVKNNTELCCDISDVTNPMCWGCYIVYYETQTDFEKEEDDE